jgi:outer membrane biosynthesis protein TonB
MFGRKSNGDNLSGSFLIKKKYRKTVLYSLLASSLIVIFILVGFLFFFKNHNKPKRLIPPKVVAAELTRLNIAIPEMKEEPKKIIKKAREMIKELPVEKTEEPVVSVETTKVEKPDSAKLAENESILEAQDPRLKEEGVFQCNNTKDFRLWFIYHFTFPIDERVKKSEGRITLDFTVGLNGLVDSVIIISGVDPIVDREVKAVIYNSPRWKTCPIDGRPVKQKYRFTVYLVRRM